MNDFKNIVSQKLNKLGTPASTIASLSDVSGGRFSNWLNGVSSLPHDKAQQTYGVVTDLERLVDLAAPLPLDFSKVNALRRCIEGLRDGTLKILVQKNEPSTQEKAFAIQFANGNFFHSQDPDGQILHTINFLQGAMVSESVAAELIKIFEHLGHRAKAVENKFTCDPSCEVEQVWRSAAVEVSAR